MNREEIKELKARIKEDEMVGDLLAQSEEERSSKKKRKELKRLLSEAKTQVEKAEELLRELILNREDEDRKIEDAILLSDGVRKVQETEREDDERAEKETEKENENEEESEA